MENEKEIRYFSMFTGVGGFELGIGDKAECIGFSEIDKYANELTSKKFPNITNFGDCTKINPSELPDFDMLCGGFPCQSFSIAGKRRGFQDTRGTMFFEVARILEVKKPKLVFLENVKGLLNHDKGETFKVIIQTLSELGYDVQWMVLNSKFFGVPQNRERVFIIGSLRGEPRPEILPFRTNNKKIIEQHSPQVSNAITSRYYKQGNADTYVKRMDTQIGRDKEIYRFYSDEGISPALHLKTGGWQEPKIAILVLTPNREEKRQNGRRFKENGDESFTLTKTDIHGVMIQSHSPRTNDASLGGSGPLISDEHCFTIDRTPHQVINNFKIRRLTPLECERLQGFPDNWTEGFSDTQRYKMMGNAVTTKVITAIARKLY